MNVSSTLTNTTIWFVAALSLIVDDVRTDGHFYRGRLPKHVRPVLAINGTEQSLTAQTNNYAARVRQRLASCSGSSELNYRTRHLLFSILGEVVNLFQKTEDLTSANDFLTCPFKNIKTLF